MNRARRTESCEGISKGGDSGEGTEVGPDRRPRRDE